MYGPEFIQITADTFIYRIGIKVLKIRVYLDQYRPAMETIDEQIFERSFGCSERIVGERYIIYQWNENNYVNLNLFNIDDIHVPLQTFRLDKEPRHEPNIFGLFTIHEEKLYFFTKFDNPAADNERMVLNLGSLHVYDMKTGRKHIEATSTLPSFHYSPPNNIIGIVRIVVVRIVDRTIIICLATALYPSSILGRLADICSNQGSRKPGSNLPLDLFGHQHPDLAPFSW